MNKTLIISIIGFIVIITIGLITQSYLEKSADSLLKDVNALKLLIVANKSELTNKIKEPLVEEWEKTKKIWSALIDHDELDSIEEIIKRIEILLSSPEEKAELLAELNRLDFYLHHIPEKEGFELENIL